MTKIKNILIYLTTTEIEKTVTKKIFDQLDRNPEFADKKLNLKIFTGPYTLNAYSKPQSFSSNNFELQIGEKLLSKLNVEELLFVVSHELIHASNNHNIKRSVISLSYKTILIIYPFLMNKETNLILFILLGLLVLFVGFIFVGYISWFFEYKADKKALKIIKNLGTAESALKKLSKEYKNFGKPLNFFAYNHPPSYFRIKKLNEVEDKYLNC